MQSTPSGVSKRLYSVPEAAEVLALGRTSLYQLMAEGRLEAVKIGKRRLITAESIDQFLKELQAA